MTAPQGDRFISSYHVLARCMRRDQIDPEVAHVLDAIVEVASRAKPVTAL